VNRTQDFLRGRRRRQLSEAEKALLEDAIEKIETVPARKVVIRRGERVTYSTLLLSGTMCRYMDARDGYRQLVAYQIPGDFVDLHGYPLERLDHDVATISEATIALVPHARLDEIVAKEPHLARLLWFSTLLDAALHREWIFRIGRLDAAGRVAHFLMETCNRMAAIDRVQGDAFDLPLTQQDIGEACGLTSVHVNRTLRKLREEGLAEVTGGRAHILNPDRLARIGEFEADYLYLDHGPWAGAEV